LSSQTQRPVSDDVADLLQEILGSFLGLSDRVSSLEEELKGDDEEKVDDDVVVVGVQQAQQPLLQLPTVPLGQSLPSQPPTANTSVSQLPPLPGQQSSAAQSGALSGLLGQSLVLWCRSLIQWSASSLLLFAFKGQSSSLLFQSSSSSPQASSSSS